MEIVAVKREGRNALEAQCSKVPCLEGQIDVRTRCGSGSCRRARIEVFSAVLEDPDLPKYRYRDVSGFLLLQSCHRNFRIFDSSVLGPQQISPKGLLTLTGPEHSILVEDEVLVLSWFINLITCGLNICEGVLWTADVDDMDRLICRKIEFFPCNLHVSFAVYRDPVEAHFDVYFVDLECGEEEAVTQVHGTVSASNSVLPDSRAKNILFHKLSGECVSLEPGMFVPLTLSRRMTVIPHQSTLLVHVNLQVCMGHWDPLIFEDTVMFNPSSDYAEEFIILPNRGKLLVKVTWVECEDRLEY